MYDLKCFVFFVSFVCSFNVVLGSEIGSALLIFLLESSFTCYDFFIQVLRCTKITKELSNVLILDRAVSHLIKIQG